ncbi:hypothetical protein [Lacrimispora aerotolerans]|uniref:hypothetical protein n=1 Tax=Lacrimispora aerotolerans TaxID=36832 RepID=UPI00047AFE16|nr:hypothetical protein [Lacrimispora aerotolerans]
MPKLKPSHKEALSRVERACISSNMDLYCLYEENVAVKLGITQWTIQNKRARPGTFTLSELWDLSKSLKLTPVQAASIVLRRPLTSKEIKEFILL